LEPIAVLFCFIELFFAANGAGPISLDQQMARRRAFATGRTQTETGSFRRSNAGG
jgi:hypothetical protein